MNNMVWIDQRVLVKISIPVLKKERTATSSISNIHRIAEGRNS